MELDRVLKVTDGTGICSCLTVRLHDACQYYEKNGYYPTQIDSSSQFSIYKEHADHRLDEVIMNDYVLNSELPFVNFNHGWQYAWYNEVQLEKLSKIALTICPPTKAVGDKSYQFMQRMGSRTAVLFRGNDKVKEIPTAPYLAIIEMALATGANSFLVQTDEFEFYETFKSVFPDTIRFEEIDMINKNEDAYFIPKENNSDFLINFVAALRAIGHAEKLITITGNTGLWTMFFRGNTRNTWQYNGRFLKWKKLL